MRRPAYMPISGLVTIGQREEASAACPRIVVDLNKICIAIGYD